MPRGPHLTLQERRTILNLHHQGHHPTRISEAVERSTGAVYSTIRRPEKTEVERRAGRPPLLSPAQKRITLRIARKGQSTARELKESYSLPISVSRIRQILSADPHLRWKRLKRAPGMNSQHYERRVQWAHEHISWEQVRWDQVVWSDEKRFTLDGPDGSAYYWADKRCRERFFNKHHSGRGGVMVWGGFSSRGTTELCFVDLKMNASRYVNVLEEYLLPFAYSAHGTEPEDFVFMQDNARPHTARVTTDFLNQLGVTRMNWPACSPDLNPIENLWGFMTQKVYHNSHQFTNVNDLKDCITRVWNEIPQNIIDSLNGSMRNRCLEVLSKQGRPLNY